MVTSGRPRRAAVARDADVGAERQLEAAAERDAVQRGDHRRAQRGEAVEQHMAALAPDAAKAKRVERGPLLDVGARRERPAGAGQHHGADLGIALDLGERSRSSASSIGLSIAFSLSGRFRVSVSDVAAALELGALDEDARRLAHDRAPPAARRRELEAPSARGGTGAGPSARGRRLTRSGMSAWPSTSRSRSTPGAISATSRPASVRRSTQRSVTTVTSWPCSRGAPAAEGHLLDLGHELPDLALADDAQAVLDRELEAAGREGAAEHEPAAVCRDVDEAADAGGEIGPAGELGDVDVAGRVDLQERERRRSRSRRPGRR